jgi:CTP synthase
MKNAHSTEMNSKTKFPVIDLMQSQQKVKQKGGTMRLGAYRCKLIRGSKSSQAYGKQLISERHRHRYEFNNKFLKDFESQGMMAVGLNPDNGLVEIIEITSHPWFVGVQYHPELKSTVDSPHPLFVRFIKAAMEHQADLRS